MIYYEKANIRVTEEDNLQLWQACENVCYGGRVVMSYSRKDIQIQGAYIALPAILPVAFEVEPKVAENLVQVSVIPGLSFYSIEILYHVGNEIEE